MSNIQSITDDDKRAKQIVALIEKFTALKLKSKAVNAERAAIIDKVAAQGIDRKAFRDMAKQHETDEDKRLAYEASCRIIRKAFGWPEQGDLFDDGLPDNNDETDLPDLPGIGAENIDHVLQLEDEVA